MRIVVGASVVAGFLLAITWVGCVGDDPQPSGVTPDPGVADGDFRGRCNNGRCLEGLVCNQGVCLYPDYPDGGTPPGVTRDGGGVGGEGGVDSGVVPCPRTDPALTGGDLLCPGADGGTCSNGYTCCVNDTTASCEQTAANCPQGSTKPVDCDGPTQCGTKKCCIHWNMEPDQTKCPIDIHYAAFDKTYCDNFCTGGAVKVCRTDQDCGTGVCQRMTLTLQSGTIMRLGICQ